MTRADKIRFWFQLIFQLLLVVAGIVSVFTQNWINLALSIFTLFLTFLPSLIEKRFRINLPGEFEIVVLVFIYLSMYLGEIQNFYILFPWWDLFLHAISGVLLGAVGLALVHLLNEHKVTLKMSPGFVALFAFTFAVALGVGWEIFEFSMDSFLGLNMQKSGLVDTMWDLIVNTFGAALVALLGYLYLKKDPRLIESLEKKYTHSR